MSDASERIDVPAEVRRLVEQQAPAWGSHDLDDDLAIGSGGLGLDSVGIVELLIACEKRFGIGFPAELLEGTPLTVGRLVEHIRGRLAD